VNKKFPLLNVLINSLWNIKDESIQKYQNGNGIALVTWCQSGSGSANLRGFVESTKNLNR
jgi:hypothetical protein